MSFAKRRVAIKGRHDITTDEADNLIATKYHMFPITRAAYAIDGGTITVRYTIDNCD